MISATNPAQSLSAKTRPVVTLADLGDGIQIARIEHEGMSFDFDRARMFDIVYRDAGTQLLHPPIPNPFEVMARAQFPNGLRFPFEPGVIGFYSQTIDPRPDGYDIVTPVKIPQVQGVILVRIRITISGDDVRLGIDVDGNPLANALYRVIFPILKIKPVGDAADDILVIPSGPGGFVRDPAHWNGLPLSPPSHSSHVYSMQFAAYYQVGGPMLYLQTEDSAGYLKEFWFEGRGTGTLFYLVNYPPNAARPGNAPTTAVTWTMPYPVVLSVLKGDWYDAARRYRMWALKQPWAARGPIRESPEISEKIRGLQASVLRYLFDPVAQSKDDLGLHADDVIRLRDFLGIDQLQAIWQSWHTNPFDTGWPDYQVKRTFRAALQRAQSAGIGVAPYTLIHFWDVAVKSWQQLNGPMRTVKDEIGRTYVLRTSPGALLAQVDPTREDSRQIVLQLWKRLKDEFGVDGFYLDYWSGLPVALDFDPSLAQPGDTSAFMAGKRALGQLFKDVLKGWNGSAYEDPDFYLLSEGVDEMVLDKIDGVGAEADILHYSSFISLPLWTTVYHEHALVGDLIDKTSPDSHAFVYHSGWIPTFLNLDPEQTLIADPVEQSPFLDVWQFARKLLATDPFVRRFRIFGEMLRPLPGSTTDLIDKSAELQETGIRSSVWKDGEDVAVLITNAGEVPESFQVTMRRDRYPLQGPVRLVEHVDGDIDLSDKFDDAVSFEVTMPPRSVKIFEIVPAASIKTEDKGVLARRLTIQKPVGVSTADSFSKIVRLASSGPASVTLVVENLDSNTRWVQVTAQISNDRENWKDTDTMRVTSIGHGTMTLTDPSAAWLRVKFTLTATQPHLTAAAVCAAEVRGVEE